MRSFIFGAEAVTPFSTDPALGNRSRRRRRGSRSAAAPCEYPIGNVSLLSGPMNIPPKAGTRPATSQQSSIVGRYTQPITGGVEKIRRPCSGPHIRCYKINLSSAHHASNKTIHLASCFLLCCQSLCYVRTLSPNYSSHHEEVGSQPSSSVEKCRFFILLVRL